MSGSYERQRINGKPTEVLIPRKETLVIPTQAGVYKRPLDDPDFADHTLKLLGTSTKALRQYGPYLKPALFKPMKPPLDRHGRARSLAAEVILQYSIDGSPPELLTRTKPIGSLLRQAMLGTYKELGLDKQREIDSYLTRYDAIHPQRIDIDAKLGPWLEQVWMRDFLTDANEKCEAGLTPEYLQERLNDRPIFNSPPSVISAEELLTMSFPEQKFVFDWLMPANELVMLAGNKNFGKTTLALQIALAVSRGRPLFDRKNRTHGPVLFVSFEESALDLKLKLKRLQGKDAPGPIDFVNAMDDDGTERIRPLNQGGVLQIQTILKTGHQGKDADGQPSSEPYAMVVIDHLIAAYSASNGNDRAKDMLREEYRQTKPLRDMALKTPVTVLLLHHNRKCDSGEFIHSPAGSVGVTASAGALWVLGRDPENTKLFRRLYVIGRRIGKEKLLRLEIKNDGFALIEEGSDIAAGPQQHKILKLLRQHGPLPPKAIAQKLSLDVNAVYQVLHRMGRLVEKQSGSYGIKLDAGA